MKTVYRDGIIMLDVLLQLDDLKVVEKILNEGYITFYELISDLLKKEKYKELFRFYVDNNMERQANRIMKGDYEHLIEHPVESLPEKLQKIELLNQHILQNTDLYHRQKTNPGARIDSVTSCFFVYGKEDSYKVFIINELSEKQERARLIATYNKSTEDITEEYLLNLVKKGESDLAVIKLCSKLEAIFICEYNLEGDLFTMMDKWRNKYGIEDNGWEYPFETRTSKLLQKLRKNRNSVAHPTDKGEKLTFEEFEECIKVVFNL